MNKMHNYEIPGITLGAGSFYIKNTLLNIQTEIPDEPISIEDEMFKHIRSFNLADPKSAEFTMEAEIDIPMVHRFSGVFDASMLGGQSFSAEFGEPYQEQRRKHKKKRINKKWAKRYGYVTKYRKWRIKEVTFTSKNSFEFEATGRNVELVTR